ncbi:MAG: hypothetical protein ACRD1T_18665 [Acidimicrobiia bacterium]
MAGGWEYWVESHSIAERWGSGRQAKEIEQFMNRLNTVGAEGWEMIGFNSVPLVGGITGNVKGYTYLTFWKRPK